MAGAGKRSDDETAEATIVALRRELGAIRRELTILNSHRFVRVHNSTWRLIAFQFARGLALGLGTVIGATILVSFLGYMLAQVDFIPIVGEWASEIARQIQEETN